MSEKRQAGASVDRRRNAGIDRAPLDEVKSIQALLADVYKDAGDGRTLLRELVQNADDARATRQVCLVLESGWPDAQNGLLHGAALVVANDGAFPAADRDAVHRAIGGSKAEDLGKVGRFGIGLKSVFHICEAFVYLGVEQGLLRPGALNPWAGTGGLDDVDPIHPDWDHVGDRDLERLRELATTLLGELEDGLIQWIPLRCKEHLDRGANRRYGIGQVCPGAADVATWFGRPTSLALLLAQCGHLQSIEATRANDPQSVSSSSKLASVVRPGFEPCSWVGRHDDDSIKQNRSFKGTIKSGERHWSVVGVDAVGGDKLGQIRSDEAWPKDSVWRDGKCSWFPRKVLSHAAITFLRRGDRLAAQSGTRLRWAVFLALDDHPEPQTSQVVEVSPRKGSESWDIILHGYFWPSQDRRSIPGVTDDDEGAGDTKMRSRWNRAVRDELLLPLLPGALANAICGLDQRVAWDLIDNIAGMQCVKSHLEAIIRKDILLPVAWEKGVRWNAFEREHEHVLAVPDWCKAPPAVCRAFLEREVDGDVTVIDADAPRLGGKAMEWSRRMVASLLESISADVLRSADGVSWTGRALRAAIDPVADSENGRAAEVARWLVRRMGEGVLHPAVCRPGDGRDKLQESWRELLKVLPGHWVLEAPPSTYQAVVELATGKALGPGLLPLPFGQGKDGESENPETEQIDPALLELGKLLREEAGPSSPPLQKSRLRLAECLLLARGDLPLTGELSHLPLLRVKELPADKDVVWSVHKLRREAADHRVFARSADDQAVSDLAAALGCNLWRLDGKVAPPEGANESTSVGFARSVLCAEEIPSSPKQRRKLLNRLAVGYKNEPTVRTAARRLLVESFDENDEDTDLLYVRSSDCYAEQDRRTLKILLRILDRSWVAIGSEFVEQLLPQHVHLLGIRPVDDGVLYGLLAEATRDMEADWSGLDDEDSLHALQHLAKSQPNWKAMPLHRYAAGGRGPIDDSAWLVSGSRRPPAELDEEVQLLDPDPPIAKLYYGIRLLDDEGILRLMLESDGAYKYFQKIVDALREAGGNRFILPQNLEVRELLKCRPWLPCRDAKKEGLAPDELIVLPDELASSVEPLSRQGALSGKRLASAVDPEAWEMAKRLVAEIQGRLNRARRVQRLVDALDSDRVAAIGGGEYLILSSAERLSYGWVEYALRSQLPDVHKGWALLRAVGHIWGEVTASRRETDHTGRQEAVLSVARFLCGPVPAQYQSRMLSALGEAMPQQNPQSWSVFLALIEDFSRATDFHERVLHEIRLPTQDGQWRDTRVIARSSSGLAKRHLLRTELRSCLRLDSDEPVLQSRPPIRGNEVGNTTLALSEYFATWRGRLPDSAVGAFLSVLGDGPKGSLSELAQEWLSGDVSIDAVREELCGKSGLRGVRVFYSGRVAHGKIIKTMNLLGDRVEMASSSNTESVLATDPESLDNWGGDFWDPQLGDIRRGSRRNAANAQMLPFWSLTLREVGPENRTTHELLEMLGEAVEWLAAKILRADRPKVQSWWKRWGTGSQVHVGPVQASILAHLPLTLRQLDVRGCEALTEAQRLAERAQRHREQERSREAQNAEHKALDHLGSLILEHPEHQRFLWERVRGLMKLYGYGEDSVLLELAQNADDALVQAAEIAGGAIPREACRLVVRVHEVGKVPTVDVIHHGRPINETGGAAFPAGRARQWDQDLYFMMLLNLSSKPRELPGEETPSATTGRFGLGFKSVHLVSQATSVVSGYLAFRIDGGLLPVEETVPDDPDLDSVEGQLATRVRLPLPADAETPSLVTEMFRRFSHARALLPAFARRLCEIVVEGSRFPGISTFDGQEINGAPGWSIARGLTDIPGHGQWRLLRFRPADARYSTGTAAILVGLKEEVPSPLPSDIPFLWNVAPTSEGWGYGYAVNGPFKLDPGRTHVSLDDPATLQVVRELGQALGQGLVVLHDRLLQGGGAGFAGLPTAESTPTFIASLYKVLAAGMDSPDDLRRDFLRLLHTEERGLGQWVGDRSVVPTGLSAPFAEHLPPLREGTHVEVAAGGLENPALCLALDQVPEIVALLGGRRVVSEVIARSLRPLLGAAITRLNPADVLSKLVEEWNYVLTAESSLSLRPLAESTAWDALSRATQGASWHTRLVARAADGALVSIRDLLLPGELEIEGLETQVEDEAMRAAFAPESCTLHPDYITKPSDISVFMWLRVRHQIDARTMAGWYSGLAEQKRPAALRYLLHGRLQQEVLQHLVPYGARPDWLAEYDAVRGLLARLGETDFRCSALLGALFQDRFEEEGEPPEEPNLSESASETFFGRFLTWWNEEADRGKVLESYESRVWPDWLRREGIAEGLRNDSREHWLGLLVLGACQSIGRTTDDHHRGFLETAHQEEWWEVFMDPEETTAWMNLLKGWQDRSVSELKYAQWMSLFPTIYQLSRYLDRYRRLLASAGNRPAELLKVTCLLAPRTDDALTGTGQQFDAPPAPLNMGLHWVLRELVRYRVIDGEHVYPDCWVPTKRILQFLLPLGLRQVDPQVRNPEKARAVFEFLAKKLDVKSPHLHRSFDIPLRHVDGDLELRQRLGLGD
jgi:hypothetical protein